MPPLIRKRLEMEFGLLAPINRFVTLQIDEMHVMMGTVYDFVHDEIIGLAENTCTPDGEVVMANKLLCFYLKGLSKNIKIPVSFHFVKNLTAKQLYDYTMKVLQEVEDIGFLVTRIATDNASTNVKLFEKLNGGTGKFVIPHPLDPKRLLFLSYDYTHLLKNVTSQWRKKSFVINGNPVSFAPVARVYDLQDNAEELKPVYRLDRRAIDPTNLEKQKVRYHLQVYHSQVLASMKMYRRYNYPGFENIKETLDFMEMVAKFWRVHDVCNTTQHIHQRLPDKRQFDSPRDDRLRWLEVKLPEAIEKWHRSTEPHQRLSDETFNALIFTCKSTAACIRYLLEQGFRFVLTRNFSTDAIERFFGAVRAQNGANDTPTPARCIDAINRIVRTSIGYASINGNVPLDKESEDNHRTIPMERTKNVTKMPASSFLKEINFTEEEMAILDEFNHPPGRKKSRYPF